MANHHKSSERNAQQAPRQRGHGPTAHLLIPPGMQTPGQRRQPQPQADQKRHVQADGQRPPVQTDLVQAPAQREQDDDGMHREGEAVASPQQGGLHQQQGPARA